MKEKKFFGLDKNVTIAGLVSFFMDISSEMIYPLIPLFLANSLGVNKSVIGLIEGVAESTASLLKVFSGWFSDRIGNRKWLMFLGYGISVLSRPFIALAGGWRGVMSARFIDRFGKGIRTAPRDAIIAESTDKSSLAKAFSYHRAMDTMGAVIGPALSFFLLGIFSNDFRKIFWLSAIPGVIAILLIFFFISEKKKSDIISNAEKPNFKLANFNWKFRFFVVISFIFALGNSSDAFLILRAELCGIASYLIPLLYLSFNLIYSFSAIPAGLAADRFGKKRVIIAGFILFAIIYYGFALASNAKIIWILFCTYGIFMGLTEGVQKAFLVTIMPQDLKATGFGIYATVTGLAMFPASLIGGLLWEHFSPSATFYFGSITACISALMFTVFVLATKLKDNILQKK